MARRTARRATRMPVRRGPAGRDRLVPGRGRVETAWGQLGPQLLFVPFHLVAPRGHRVPHPVAGALGHLAGRPTHLDHQGVGLQLGRRLLDGAADPRSAHSDEPAPMATPVTSQKVRLGIGSAAAVSWPGRPRRC